MSLHAASTDNLEANRRSVFNQYPNDFVHVKRGLMAKLVVLVACFCNVANAEIQFTPELGNLGRDNSHSHQLIPVYSQNFEDDLADLEVLGAGSILTKDSQHVLEGLQSVRLNEPFTGFELPADELRLAPLETYVIEYRYRTLDAGSSGLPVIVGAKWSGQDTLEPILGGPLVGVFPDVGSQRLSIRVANVLDASLVFVALDSDIIIDELKIYRYAISAERPKAPIPTALFPRLGNYNLDRTMATALRNGLTVDDVEETLGLYDLVTGLEADHTFGFVNGAARLRELNPQIILFPYFQSYVSQFPTETSFGGSAWFRGLFNEGLKDEWFMRGPDGSLLNEPLFPFNYQMNHTDYGTAVEGVTYRDYVRHFLTRTLLPSGLWQGVHFDQAEWHPNPLLRTGDPFLGTLDPLPPIDLDDDGQAESENQLYQAWREAFASYFDELDIQLGASAMLFGNSGFIPAAPDILSRLNGWQAEFLLPYPLDDNGNYDTSQGGQVLDLLSRYEQATRLTRSPHVINLQFTGHGLGTLTGDLTANGLPDRNQVLESRDFKRVRFGLALTLMYDGYFGYDYVDNTTAPLWFDEFAVAENGVPIKDRSGKGYLGQPLGESQTLVAPAMPLLAIGFEQTPPTHVTFGTGFRLTIDPDEVISGVRSIVFEQLEGSLAQQIFATNPSDLPLVSGKTYELSLDYKILSYQPAQHETFLFAGFSDPVNGLSLGRISALFDVDVAGAGQTGRLRTIVRLDSVDTIIEAAMSDVGTVVIDNIHLVETAGEVMRRDFENGVVLVNPSPNLRVLSQEEIAGPSLRTGLRRIQGVQDSDWNDGTSVTDGLQLPSGEGLILLADYQGAPQATTPFGLTATVTSPTIVKLDWAASNGTVAGYKIRYGEQSGDRTRLALASTQTGAKINGLHSGRHYAFQVAAYDYQGNTTDYSDVVLATTDGTAPEQPVLFQHPGPLVPGDIVTFDTSGGTAGSFSSDAPPYPAQAAGTQLFINGMAAPIVSTDISHVSVVVPWNVAGDAATVRLEREGVSSPELLMAVAPAAPVLWSIKDKRAIVVQADTMEVITPMVPAHGGATLILAASGMGTLEPPPPPGQLPLAERPSQTRFKPQVLIGGYTVSATASIIFDELGVYGVQFVLPHGLPAGDNSVVVESAGRISDPVFIDVAAIKQTEKSRKVSPRCRLYGGRICDH